VNVGLHGKLPSHGDFLRRRVSTAFVDAWDGWLQRSIAASRELLGENWLELYLTSPVWRFACAPGASADSTTLGIMVPSVDRVGRYYPLTIVAELSAAEAAQSGPLALASLCEPWFKLIEHLVIEALSAEHLDFETFDVEIAASSALLEPLIVAPAVVLDPEDAKLLHNTGGGGWHVPLASADTLSPVIEQLAYSHISGMAQPLSVWWTDGSASVASCCLFARGLPPPEGFAAFLDGDWSRGASWNLVRAKVTPQSDPVAPVVVEPARLEYVSAGRSERGPVRETNQDSLLERSEAGIWVVADGMGGHEQGELASRMVCDALTDLTPDSTLDGLAAAVHSRLGAVNAHLHRVATRAIAPVRSGTTVVVLITRGSGCQVFWAGDSRAYRLREGQLEPLTRDHVWTELESAAQPRESFAVTRAVGGEETLALDVYRGDVRMGDRFLLCSDGLSRALSDTEISHHLGAADFGAAVNALVDAALKAGSTDNVTAVLVATR
jgi:type VI secretion system ImpM family protein